MFSALYFRYTLHVLTVSDVAALVGMVLGTAGFVMALMNYLRDKPRVKVLLQWDMRVTDNLRYDSRKRWGLLRITNVGRRPIFISVAALKLPDGFIHSDLVLTESIGGRKLSEGDAPAVFVLSQDGLEKYKSVWRDVRGYVEDSAYGKYLAQKVDKSKIPSWAR